MLDRKLLDILACPVCKGNLHYERTRKELICLIDRLAFPIRDDVPVMLSTEAREITSDERDSYR